MIKYVLLAALTATLIAVFGVLKGLKIYLKEHEHETVEKNMEEINRFITLLLVFSCMIIACIVALFTIM